MWNRRDFAVLATAAVATFGLTLAGVYPRLANAVDQAPASTVEVKTPTLELGTAQVTAARDEADPNTVLFTVKNITDKPSTVEFLAQVMESPSVPSGSRSMPVSQPVWSQEMSSTLKAGETQTLKVALPASLSENSAGPAQKLNNTKMVNANAINAKAVDSTVVTTYVVDTQALSKNAVSNNAVTAKAATSARPMTPPARYLTLAGKAQPQRTIRALSLTASAPVVQISKADIPVVR
jgi:hypothetical protein